MHGRGALLSRGELLSGFRVQAAVATGRSPLTAAVLRAHVKALEETGPQPLRDLLLGSFAPRRFAHPWEAPLVAAAAVHYQVLTSGCPLAAFYPSAGGRFSGTEGEEAALGLALTALAATRPAEWEGFLVQGQLQTNEPGRAIAWLQPARALQAERGMPLDLVELGASAGLLLVGDQLDPDGAALHVERRVGIDLAPRDVGDPLVRRGLRACVWADQLDRLRRLDGAIDHLLALRQRGLAPLLLAGDMCGELPAALRHLRSAPTATPRRLIVYNTVATAYLDDDAYLRLQMRVRSVLTEWSGQCGPALWIEMEPVRGSTDATLELAAYRLRGPALQRILLGRTPPHPCPGEGLDRHGPGWAALLRDE